MNRARHLLPAALLLGLALAAAAPAPARPLGDLAGLRREGDDIILGTMDGDAIIVQFLAEDLLHLQVGPGGWIASEGSGRAPIVLPHDRAPVTITVTAADDHHDIATPRLILRAYHAPARFELYRVGESEPVWREMKPLEVGKGGSWQTLARREGERFFGGGQQNGSFEFAGRLLEVSYSGGWDEGDRSNPAPFYLSSRGYGVLRNTWTPGSYDFRSEDYLVARHQENRFDAYYFTGATIGDVLARYTWLTGRAPLLPRWAFEFGDADCYNDRDNADKPGTVPAGWSDGPTGTTPDVVASVARPYREHDMPGGWILPNDGYGCGYTDLPAVVDSLRALGFHTGLWTEDGLDRIAWEVGTAGTRVQKLDVAWTGDGYQKAMDANAAAAQGILDNSDSRPFVWTVMGWAGIQRYAVTWTGDQAGGWDYIRWHVPTLVGSGLSGQVYATGDVDGIYGGSPETYTRDLQWKCFTPVLMGMSGWSAAERKHPWWFAEPYRSINRRYLELKQRLMPYMYTLAWRAEQTGAPLVRGLMWDHADDPHAFTEDFPTQFCLGPDLLVAPVCRSQQASGGWRDGIHLPEGAWIDWWDGTVTTAGPAGVDVTVQVTLEKLPVFVRAGAILPLYPESLYDGQVPTDVLTLDVYPAGASRYELYEDDGATRAYLGGAFSLQMFTARGEAGQPGTVTVDLGRVRGAFDGLHEQRAYEVLVHTRAAPKDVTLDGAKLRRLAAGAPADATGWSYDANDRGGVVRVRTAQVDVRQPHAVAVRIPRGARATPPGAYPPAPARDAAIPAGEMLVVARPAEEPGHPLENAFDGNPDTWFRTVRGQSVAYGPHEFTLAFPDRRLVDGIRVRPRNDQHWRYGNVRRCEVYVADVNGEWGAPVFADTLALADSLQTVRFPARAGRLLRFRVLSTHDMDRDPLVRAAAGAAADSAGAWRAGDAVKVSPLTIGEFQVLEQRAASPGAPTRTWLTDLPWDVAGTDVGTVTRDRAPDGGDLRLFGLARARGLGATGDSRVEFDLDGAPQSLRCEAGLQDGAPADARARFQVWGDGRLLWDSGELKATDVVKPVLDVRGVGRLALVARATPASATAVWANPVVDGRTNAAAGHD